MWINRIKLITLIVIVTLFMFSCEKVKHTTYRMRIINDASINYTVKNDYPFTSYNKELEEEINATEEDITNTELKLIFKNDRNDICFYFETQLNIKLDKVLEGFEQKNTDIGTAGIEFYRKEEYIKELKARDTNYAFMASNLTI